jgi:DNA-binding LacI/PurR family transcriptional regulator
MDEIGLSLGPNGELSGRDLRADRLRGYEGLVLCSLRPAEDLLAHVSRRHLPLVMVNNHHPQVRTAAVLPDYSQGAFELCQHLIQLGHERIRLVVDGACLPAAAAAEGGYQAAIQRFGARAFPSITIDPSSREDQLMEAVVGTQATAIVCAGARPAVILDRSRRPDASDERMSIGCIPQAGDATAADAGLTAYETDPRQVAHGIAELLLSAAPARWQRVVVVPGKLTIRASTGPPAGRARDGIGGTPLP